MFASFYFGIFKMAASVTALGRRTTFWRWSMRFSLFCKEQRKVYGWRSSFMLITTALMFSGGYIFFGGSELSIRSETQFVPCFCFICLRYLVCLLRFSWTDIDFHGNMFYNLSVTVYSFLARCFEIHFRFYYTSHIEREWKFKEH